VWKVCRTDIKCRGPQCTGSCHQAGGKYIYAWDRYGYRYSYRDIYKQEGWREENRPRPSLEDLVRSATSCQRTYRPTHTSTPQTLRLMSGDNIKRPDMICPRHRTYIYRTYILCSHLTSAGCPVVQLTFIYFRINIWSW